MNMFNDEELQSSEVLNKAMFTILDLTDKVILLLRMMFAQNVRLESFTFPDGSTWTREEVENAVNNVRQTKE